MKIKENLEILRPDIKLVCFLDSFKKGKIDDIEIKSPFDFENLNCEFDYIIISSVSNKNKIKIIEKALWDKNEMLHFKAIEQAMYTGSSVENVANLTTLNKEGHFIDVEAISIDEFVKENNINKVDFIKMDLENSELNALNGAIETIKRDRPQMAICIYHSFEHFIEIPLFLNKTLDKYVYKLYYEPIDKLCEIIIQAIPKEIYQKRHNSLWEKIFKMQ